MPLAVRCIKTPATNIAAGVLYFEPRCLDRCSDFRPLFGYFLRSHTRKARRAIDWLAISGDERNSCRQPALRADDFGDWLPLQAQSFLAIGPALRAACGDIDEFALLVKGLLTGRPHEWLAALAASQRFITEFHLWPPSPVTNLSLQSRASLKPDPLMQTLALRAIRLCRHPYGHPVRVRRNRLSD
jgi:hypothetical protein